MLTYEVTSDKPRVIDGLGVFEADTPRVFSETDVEGFKLIRGIPLNQDNVTDGVKVVIKVDEEVKG